MGRRGSAHSGWAASAYLILLDEDAEATLVESHTGTPGFSTIVNEVRLATGARLTHVRLDRLGLRQASAITLGELASARTTMASICPEGGPIFAS